MHRIASLPTEEPSENLALIEQPHAPILFLTSAASDVSTLAYVLQEKKAFKQRYEIRAIHLNSLKHNAQIDHYISTTGSKAKIIIVRFLGNRSVWSYGFEQLGLWQLEKPNRHLIVVSGIESTANDVQEISSLNQDKVDLIQKLLNQGGIKNYNYLIQIFEKIIDLEEIYLDSDLIEYHDELIKWKWKKNNNNPSIAVFLYKSLLQSGNTELADKINDISNKYNLNAKIIWITSFKSKNIENQIISLLEKENIKAIITTTSFSSVEYKHDDVKKNLWDRLDIPVYQLLISSSSITEWKESTVGLNPIDLSIQVVLPEVDGRICTIPVAFKNLTYTDNELSIAVYKTEPYEKHIEWCIKYIKNLTYLQQSNNSNKKIALVIANYPVKDSRIANGVGLDTPESLLNILNWLKDEGYNLGNKDIPANSKELINLIVRHRTNSEETISNEPQSYLNIQDYLIYLY